jgi:hypothetical protein
MTISKNSLVMNVLDTCGVRKRELQQDGVFLFGASTSNDRVASFQRSSTDPILVSAASALEVAVIIKRHGAEQKVVCFDQ